MNDRKKAAESTGKTIRYVGKLDVVRDVGGEKVEVEVGLHT